MNTLALSFLNRSSLFLQVLGTSILGVKPFNTFLAHLSRRLIGELIVYEGIRRPSVRPSSVCRPSSVNIFKRHLL